MAAATGFGLGLSPVAPGTFGTLPGVAVAVLLAPLPLAAHLAVLIALALAAVPLCTLAEQRFGREDDGRIVADEWMTFPICVIGLPLHPAVLAMAFVTHRLLDIVKPPPARQAQRLRAGWGIVADDVFSSLYALALNHALVAAAGRLLSLRG